MKIRYNYCEKRWMWLVAIFLLPKLSTAQEKEAITPEYLHPYLITAAENNAELQALHKEYLAALQEIPQVSALPDPQSSFQYFIQPMETRLGAQNFTASVSQKFPWFGTLKARENVAAERARMALQMFSMRKKELFRDLQILYNKLYYLHVQIKMTEENLELLGSFKRIAQVYFESGKAGFTSVLQVEMEEEELSSRLLFMRESEAPLLMEFEQLLNEDLKAPLIYPEQLWEEELLIKKDEIADETFENNPYLKRLAHAINIEEYQMEVAEKEGLPSFNIGLGYTNIAPREDMQIADNGRDAIMFPQIGISLPIFRGRYKAMRKQEMLEKEAAELRKENAENELMTEFEQLYRDYLDAQRNVKLYSRLSQIAQQSLDLLQTELTTGKTDFFEIIRMQRQLLSYQLELEKARTNRNNNVYRINYLIGKNYE